MCHVWSSTEYYQNRGGFSGPGNGKKSEAAIKYVGQVRNRSAIIHTR